MTDPDTPAPRVMFSPYLGNQLESNSNDRYCDDGDTEDFLVDDVEISTFLLLCRNAMGHPDDQRAVGIIERNIERFLDEYGPSVRLMPDAYATLITELDENLALCSVLASFGVMVKRSVDVSADEFEWPARPLEEDDEWTSGRQSPSAHASDLIANREINGRFRAWFLTARDIQALTHAVRREWCTIETDGDGRTWVVVNSDDYANNALYASVDSHTLIVDPLFLGIAERYYQRIKQEAEAVRKPRPSLQRTVAALTLAWLAVRPPTGDEPSIVEHLDRMNYRDIRLAVEQKGIIMSLDEHTGLIDGLHSGPNNPFTNKGHLDG